MQTLHCADSVHRLQLISYLSLFVPTPDNSNLVVRTSIGMFVLLTQ